MILRDRQKEIFVQRYVSGLSMNATKAAADAGIPMKDAKAQGERWLTEPLIRDRIAELLYPALRRCDITPDRIIEQYARIAFSDPRQCFDDQGNLMNLAELSWDVIAGISEYSPTKFGHRIKFESRKAALDKLAEIVKVIQPEGDTSVTVQLINFEEPPAPCEFD